MRAVLERVDPVTFEQHPLHSAESIWPNTNCYLDVWIELLNSLGLDPVPALACALSAEFVGDQWEFLKIRLEDLETLYGIRVGEYDVWRPMLEHLRFQMGAGNLVVLEVDSYYLPDTRGVSYRLQHTKSSIVPTEIDPERGTMTYFHNEGLHRLDGEDFEMTLGPGAAQGLVPKPYVELIRLDRVGPPALEAIWSVFRQHVVRIAAGNPMDELIAYIRGQLPSLSGRELEYFHDFGFATTRQAGLTAMLSAAYCRSLAQLPLPDGGVPGDGSGAGPSRALEAAAECFEEASASAKKLQFQLARVAGGRSPDLGPVMEALSAQWARGIALVREGAERA